MCALTISIVFSAQTIYFTESFSDSTLGQFTATDADADGNNWTSNDFGTGNGEGPVATSASYDNTNGPLTPDNWLISPAVDLSSVNSSSSVYLNWKVIAQDPAWPSENYTVYVATGDQITDFTASSTTFNEILLTSTVYMNRTLDISTFIGQTIYFAARHHNCTDNFQLNMDDFVVVDSVNNTTEILTNSIDNQIDILNKSNNTVEVIINENLNDGNIALTSISGKNIYVKAITSKVEIIDLNGLASGLYMLNINFNEGTVTKKIFVK